MQNLEKLGNDLFENFYLTKYCSINRQIWTVISTPIEQLMKKLARSNSSR